MASNTQEKLNIIIFKINISNYKFVIYNKAINILGTDVGVSIIWTYAAGNNPDFPFWLKPSHHPSPTLSLITDNTSPAVIDNSDVPGSPVKSYSALTWKKISSENAAKIYSKKKQNYPSLSHKRMSHDTKNWSNYAMTNWSFLSS